MSESSATSPATSAPNNATFVWNELNTPNLAAAGKFYTTLFGWSMEHYAHGDLTSGIFKVGAHHVGGLAPHPDPSPTAPTFWLSYVKVDDLEGMCGRVEQLGGKIVLPITVVPKVGRIAVLQDTLGAYLGLFQP